jgi:hypothetical protein
MKDLAHHVQEQRKTGSRIVSDDEQVKVDYIKTFTSINWDRIPGRITDDQPVPVSDETHYQNELHNIIYPRCELRQWIENHGFFIKRYRARTASKLRNGPRSIESFTNNVLT